MSSHLDKLAPEPGYAQPFILARPETVHTFNNSHRREAKRYPAIVDPCHVQPPCSDGDNGAEIVGGAPWGLRDSRQVVVPAQVFSEGSMKDIAKELEEVVKDAAGEIVPGMSIKAQINAACDNLGYARGHWRIREAWYGDAANWRGKAIFDLLGRYNRFKAEQSRRQAMAESIQQQARG